MVTGRDGLLLSLRWDAPDARFAGVEALQVRLNESCAAMKNHDALRAFGTAYDWLPVDEALQGAPRLVIRLRNVDILRLKENPWANARDPQWRARVLQALFANPGVLAEASEL